MDLDVIIEEARWTEIGLEELAARVCLAALSLLSIDPEDCELSLLACDDARIATLNAEFRGKPTATNVLSWPTDDLSAKDPGTLPARPEPDVSGICALGDIAIAYDTCAREANEAGKTLPDHAAHLLLHGLLHLLGYDHIRDRDATLMEETEVRILGSLGINDPYRGT